MVEKKGDRIVASYTLGIVSIVLAFFTPLAGLIFGIIGFSQSKKEKSELGNRARKLNKIGIILSAILFVVSIVVATYLSRNPGLLSNFPIQ